MNIVKINTFEYKDDNERIQNIKKAVEEGNEKRKNLINATFNIFDKKKSKIILRRNYIKNKLENYEILTQFFINDKGKDQKIDFGSDIFNLDIDYRQFFILNGIEAIILENCLFTNYANEKIKDQSIIKETLFNLCEKSK